jgi:hypothetical protein
MRRCGGKADQGDNRETRPERLASSAHTTSFLVDMVERLSFGG